MTLTQITSRSIIHDEEMDAVLDIEIVNADNMGMTQACNNAGLFAKLSPITTILTIAGDHDDEPIRVY